MTTSVTSLRLPHNLPYPIFIQRLHVLPPVIKGTEEIPAVTLINKTDRLLTYSYFVENEEGKREKEVRVWESPVNGELVLWCVREGDTVRNSSDAVIHIREPCTHDVQFLGLCALCGKDLTTADYTGFSDTSRANISMAHDVGGLTVSLDEAQRLEEATTTRLLSTSKLSLIVDLDQTIVHATVDPTVGEWLADPTNPNFSALEGTGRFRLGEENDREGEGCWYYVKMRPGLNDFLKDVSKMYEMHVYTMGTRAYASEVCKIIDPDGGLFGGRILSRDESGSMTRKSLQRLFPCDTSMVVIIDDRADVWDGSPNLVKVIPYEFFVGIGDINAAFLPKKKELGGPPLVSVLSGSDTTPSPTSASPSSTEGSSSDASSPATSEDPTMSPSFGLIPLPLTTALDISVLEAVPSPFTTDSTIFAPSLSEAEASTALTIHDQIEARPLSHQRSNPKPPRADSDTHSQSSSTSVSIDGDLEVTVPAVTVEAEAGETTSIDQEEEEEETERGAVLRNDDRELDRIFKILTSVHVEFYREEQEREPDVKIIIPKMKKDVLRGVNLVFSGLIALGVRPQDSEYWKLADTFGAECSTDLRSHTTHVVANQNGTEKVYKARKRPSIQVVGAPWLLDSIAHWIRLPESPYLLPPPPSSNLSPPILEPSSHSEIHPSSLPPLHVEEGIPEPGVGTTSLKPEPEEEVREEVESYIRPSESQTGSQMGSQIGEDFDIDDVDWGDASKEIDDALNETDDDEFGEGEGESENGYLSDSSIISDRSDGSIKKGKKRERESGDEGDSISNGSGSRTINRGSSSSSSSITSSKSNSSSHSLNVGSPLQKRVKTAISRKSRLKNSYPAEGEEISSPAQALVVQASSSLDSDDDAFFSSMADELESGW